MKKELLKLLGEKGFLPGEKIWVFGKNNILEERLIRDVRIDVMGCICLVEKRSELLVSISFDIDTRIDETTYIDSEQVFKSKEDAILELMNRNEVASSEIIKTHEDKVKRLCRERLNFKD